MANLPDTPLNTAFTLGALAGLGLIAYTQNLRTKVTSQTLENYRHAKNVGAGIAAEPPVALHQERSANRTA